MSINLDLTEKEALEIIGPAVEIMESHPEMYKEFGPKQDCFNHSRDHMGFESVEGHYDMSWELTRESAYVRALRKLTETIKRHGIASSEAAGTMNDFRMELLRSGIGMFPWDYADQMKILHPDSQREIQIALYEHEYGFEPVYNLCAFEACLNAVEHGSLFGERGAVKMRFIGGQFGEFFKIQDPGKEFCYSHMSVEQAREIEEARSRELRRAQRGVNYDENRICGRGITQWVLSDYAVVNPYQTGDGFEVLVVYNLRDILKGE